MMSSFVSIGQTPPRLPFFLMIVSRARDAMLFVVVPLPPSSFVDLGDLLESRGGDL